MARANSVQHGAARRLSLLETPNRDWVLFDPVYFRDQISELVGKKAQIVRGVKWGEGICGTRFLGGIAAR